MTALSVAARIRCQLSGAARTCGSSLVSSPCARHSLAPRDSLLAAHPRSQGQGTGPGVVSPRARPVSARAVPPGSFTGSSLGARHSPELSRGCLFAAAPRRGGQPTRPRPVSVRAGVEELRLPSSWSDPEVAAQKSAWLQQALCQWLDDEFCPEPPNLEISSRCARVLQRCLVDRQLDPGDVLMEMIADLQQFSFKESFHGPFSSANAAIRLLLEEQERELQ